MTRILLFIFNILFWVLGIVVLGVGIKSRVDGGSWEGLVKDNVVLNAANLMIASGVIVSIIGFVGCCGAYKKSPCMLVSYAILIFLIFVLEIAAGAYAYTKKTTVQNDLEKNINVGIKNSYGGTTDADKMLTKAVDWFQKNIECCGVTSYADWKTSSWYKNATKKKDEKREVPHSCCINTGINCNSGSGESLKKKIFSDGCVEAGKKYVKSNLWKIGGVTVGIAIVQLFGIIFACCLCRAIKDEN